MTREFCETNTLDEGTEAKTSFSCEANTYRDLGWEDNEICIVGSKLIETGGFSCDDKFSVFSLQEVSE